MRIPKFLLLVFVLFTLLQCKSYTHVVKVDQTQIDLVQSLEADADISDIIQPYKDQLDSKMKVVIGTAEETLTKNKPESTLGNWLADLLLVQAGKEMPIKPDLAIQNYGGIRISNVVKGPVTVGKIYELMPFDNILVVVSMKGDLLLEYINDMAGRGGEPISSTVTFAIENRQAVDVELHGKKIKKDKLYFVALPDYVANNALDGKLRDLERYENGILIRDAIINHIKDLTSSGLPIAATLDGRVTLKERTND